MTIRILSDGTIESAPKPERRVFRKKKKRTKEPEVSAKSYGPEGCPLANKIENNLWECQGFLYEEKSDDGTVPRWTPLRIRIGAEVCLDCDRKIRVMKKEYDTRPLGDDLK